MAWRLVVPVSSDPRAGTRAAAPAVRTAGIWRDFRGLIRTGPATMTSATTPLALQPWTARVTRRARRIGVDGSRDADEGRRVRRTREVSVRGTYGDI